MHIIWKVNYTALALKPVGSIFLHPYPLPALPRKLLFSFSSLYLFTYSIVYCVVCGCINGETCHRAHERSEDGFHHIGAGNWTQV